MVYDVMYWVDMIFHLLFLIGLCELIWLARKIERKLDTTSKILITQAFQNEVLTPSLPQIEEKKPSGRSEEWKRKQSERQRQIWAERRAQSNKSAAPNA